MGFLVYFDKLNSRFVTLLLPCIFCFSLFLSVKCHGETVDDVAFSEHLVPFRRTSHFKNGIQRIVRSVTLGVVTGLTGVFLFACFIRGLVGYLNRTPVREGPVIFSPKMDADTLQSVLRNENQWLDSSPCGKYHRTVLDNGLTVAVKKLEPIQDGTPEAQSKSAKRRMQQQLALLAHLRHRNLMSLRAYVGDMNRCWLIYDFVPTGNLEDAMSKVRENQLQLNWELRFRIAVGIVRGLQYLHFECDPQILHCNLMPTNVMLDAEFEPRLADCGLANLMPNFDRPTSSYTAPECLINCGYTDKSDIFSFGMLLSLLLTGRDPTEQSLYGGTGGVRSLGQWLQQLQQVGEPREALDRSIMGVGVEEDEMLLALRIAAVCLSNLPEDRPSSDELLLMLTQLHSF